MTMPFEFVREIHIIKHSAFEERRDNETGQEVIVVRPEAEDDDEE